MTVPDAVTIPRLAGPITKQAFVNNDSINSQQMRTGRDSPLIFRGHRKFNSWTVASSPDTSPWGYPVGIYQLCSRLCAFIRSPVVGGTGQLIVYGYDDGLKHPIHVEDFGQGSTLVPYPEADKVSNSNHLYHQERAFRLHHMSGLRLSRLALLRHFLKSTALALGVSIFAAPITAARAQVLQTAGQRRAAVETHLSRYVVIRGSRAAELSLAAQMAALHVPAVSIAAIRNGRLDWARAYGVQSLGGISAITHTLFGAASISKPVTAVGVLKLVEQGRVDLDGEANRYLKRWKIPDNRFTAEKKVTVRELLDHTSGIGTHHGEVYDPAMPVPTLLESLDGVKPATTDPIRVEAVPGTKFAYSNGGYLVLQLLVEDVTGKPFAAYMQHAVLDPIGMKQSTFEAPLSAHATKGAATAYKEDGETAVPPSKYSEANLAAGGLWSTPTDLAKFLMEIQREYAGTSHKVLHQAMVRAMLKPGLGPGATGHWGLGFAVGGSPDNAYLSHGGSAYFENDMVAYVHGNGVVVMTSGGDGGSLTGELFRSAAGVYGFPDFQPIEHTLTPIPLLALPRFVGTYGFVKVALEGDVLTAEIPPGSTPVRLYPESSTNFFVLDGPQELAFTMDATGKITGAEFITPITHVSLPRNKTP